MSLPPIQTETNNGGGMTWQPKPTAPGFYWLHRGGQNAQVVYVEDVNESCLVYFVGREDNFTFSPEPPDTTFRVVDGWWLGPLEPPTLDSDGICIRCHERPKLSSGGYCAECLAEMKPRATVKTQPEELEAAHNGAGTFWLIERDILTPEGPLYVGRDGPTTDPLAALRFSSARTAWGYISERGPLLVGWSPMGHEFCA